MPTLADYKQTYPRLQTVWDKFNTLLDKEVFFFSPKSHHARIQQYTQKVEALEQIADIQAQVETYKNRPWYSKMWFWLFDIGDVSVKKNWLSYHQFRQQAQLDSFADTTEVTLNQLETLESSINTHLSSLGASAWRKIMKRFLKALGELLTTEKASSSVSSTPETDQNHSTPEAAMQKHNSKLTGNKDQEALIAHYGDHLRKKKSANPKKGSAQQPTKLQPSSSGIDEKGVGSPAASTATTSNASATVSSQASKVLVMSRGDGVIVQASVDDPKSYEEACWSYVFCCSFFELDWKEKDKEVLRQKFDQARRRLGFDVHPDKMPHAQFASEWRGSNFWKSYMTEARTRGFGKVGMVAQGVQVLLDNIVPYPSKEYQASIRGQAKLTEASRMGNEFRGLILQEIRSIQRGASSTQKAEQLEQALEHSRQEREQLEQRTAQTEKRTAETEKRTAEVLRKGKILERVLISLPGGQEELDSIKAELAASNSSSQHKQEAPTAVASQTTTTEAERPVESPAPTPTASTVTSPASQALIAQWQQQGPPGSSQGGAPKTENDASTLTPGPISTTATTTETEVEPTPNTRRKSVCSPC